MNDLTNSVAILGRPYQITRSRLGAVTKVYRDQFLCDLPALKELFQSIGEKLSVIQHTETPEFSFLISFSDKTHHDGVTSDLKELESIPIGKQTDRIVMRWAVTHDLQGTSNEVAITVRISNPINPLVVFQAALSKSPNDLDNFEFELGSTCATVYGAGQAYADEIFLRIQRWIEARKKPYAFTGIHLTYLKNEWLFDQVLVSLLPLLGVAAASLLVAAKAPATLHIIAVPVLVALFAVFQSFTRKLASKMSEWANTAKYMSVFNITNGDIDSIAKLGARSKNSIIKLVCTWGGAFLCNVAAGIAVWFLLPA